MKEAGCQSWHQYLSVVNFRKIDIVGRGYSGYNTRMCKPLFPILYPNKDSLMNCKFFTIFLGANDACATPQQHVPVEEYKSNLCWMIKYIHRLDVPMDRILLISLPPVDENKWGATEIAKGKVITRKLVTCAAYAAACQEVANTNDVSFVNLYEAMLVQKSWESFFSDGLHFSRRGSEFLAKILEDFFADKLSDLKWWFPDWRAIDPITPETSINHYHRSNT
ncbi:Isoamyl acetate-hydrolyzing esterase 1 like [Schistosoma japonicum]|nr:Isoamyl acetate-hydrolyzing esterase 1 like [Schistosoma japonicum]